MMFSPYFLISNNKTLHAGTVIVPPEAIFFRLTNFSEVSSSKFHFIPLPSSGSFHSVSAAPAL